MRGIGAAVVVLGALLIAFGPKQNTPAVVSDSDVLTAVLAGQKEVLYVSDNASNPVIGGLARTPSVPITPAQFEARCDHYVARYSAIVADGTSGCLRAHRAEAVAYVRGDRFELSPDGYTVFVSNGGVR